MWRLRDILQECSANKYNDSRIKQLENRWPGFYFYKKYEFESNDQFIDPKNIATNA